MARFWPGPLTVVLPKREEVPDIVTAGLPTVAVRMPSHAMALRFIELSGSPIAGPSANPFGYLSPTTAEHVREQLGDQVDLILDGGPCRVGVESTIVDCTGSSPTILRLGGVAQAAIEAVVGAAVDLRTAGTTAAPGTLPGHYAPMARVVLVGRRDVGARAAGLLATGRRVGLLASAPAPADLPVGLTVLDSPADVDDFAR